MFGGLRLLFCANELDKTNSATLTRSKAAKLVLLEPLECILLVLL